MATNGGQIPPSGRATETAFHAGSWSSQALAAITEERRRSSIPVTGQAPNRGLFRDRGRDLQAGEWKHRRWGGGACAWTGLEQWEPPHSD